MGGTCGWQTWATAGPLCARYATRAFLPQLKSTSTVEHANLVFEASVFLLVTFTITVLCGFGGIAPWAGHVGGKRG